MIIYQGIALFGVHTNRPRKRVAPISFAIFTFALQIRSCGKHGEAFVLAGLRGVTRLTSTVLSSPTVVAHRRLHVLHAYVYVPASGAL